MDNRITIHIATRDRWTELCLLLQSLRTQTYQNFDIIIIDDASGGLIIQCQPLMSLVNRLKLENHIVKIVRIDQSFGCCYARNKCIEDDDFDNPLTLRLDDDVILEPTYIEKLLEGINKGYDMITGLIPILSNPRIIRQIKRLGPVMNLHEFDKDGNIIKQNDECGYCYNESKLIPTHQFRTNCLYKSKINKEIKYPDNLTTVAFREEGFFSLSAILKGYKLAVHTGAIAYHLQTPSGGNRRPDYSQCVQIDNETFLKWCKKRFKETGDFLKKYNKEVLK